VTDETATEAAMRMRRQDDPSVCATELTRNNVERLAAEENYIYLYNAIQLYKRDPNVTWEQAMQLAAIDLSKVVKELQKLLVDVHFKQINPPILVIPRD